MEIYFSCMECQVQDGIPNFSTHAMLRLPDDGVIETTCKRGHRTFTIIQQMKFEILSEMAVKAIVDGYYRDAVASFIASLERLHEFFVEATCRKAGIEGSAYKLGWKAVANQSERQLGAFVVVHLMETGEAPKLLPRNQTEFRNDVVHKGKLPDRSETIRFGQAVAECALPILALLRSEPYAETVQKLVGERLRDRHRPAWDAGVRASTYALNTLFSLTYAEQETDIEVAVTKYAARPDMAKALEEVHKLGAILDLVRQSADVDGSAVEGKAD